MTITHGVFKIYSQLESVVHLPFRLSKTKRFHLEKNPATERFRQRALLFALDLLTFIFAIKSFLMAFSTISDAKASDTEHILPLIMRLVLHLAALLAGCIYFASETVLKGEMDEFIWVTNARCFLVPVEDRRRSKIIELVFCYFAYNYLVMFPAAAFLFPVIERSFGILHPYQPETTLVSHVITALSCLLYGIAYVNGVIRTLLQYTFVISVCDGMATYTKDFYEKDWRLFGRKQFSRCLRNFKTARLLISTFCTVTSTFLFVVDALGMLLGATCIYVSLEGFNSLPIIVAAIAMVQAGLVIGLNYNLTHVASHPNTNGKKFKEYWSLYLRSRLERRQLRSCPEIGYRIGPFRNVKKEVGVTNFRILTDIAVNLLLLT